MYGEPCSVSRLSGDAEDQESKQRREVDEGKVMLVDKYIWNNQGSVREPL